MPDRSCASKVTTGDFSIANDGVTKYKAFIDAISGIISSKDGEFTGLNAQLTRTLGFPDVRIVAVVEPNSLTNLVVNLSNAKCANAATTYKQCNLYVLQTLQQCNVWLYLDGGSGGVLGWPANIGEPSSASGTHGLG